MSEIRAPGWLFQAASSRREPAVLRADALGLYLEGAEGRERLDRDALVVSERIGRVARRVELADGRTFETDDNDAIDRMFPPRSGARSLVHWEGFHRRLVLVAIALVASVVLIVVYGVPAAADFATMFVPKEVDSAVGAATMRTLDGILIGPSSVATARQVEVYKLFGEMLTAAGLTDAGCQLSIRNGKLLGANAFALPGCHIVVTDQMLALATSDDALAGVMAHELGHESERHGMRRLMRVVGMTALVTFVVGDAIDMVEQLAAVGTTLVEFSHSRGEERAADAFAVGLLRKTGRSPAGLAALLEQMSRAGEGPAWLSSHPPSDERMRALTASPDS